MSLHPVRQPSAPPSGCPVRSTQPTRDCGRRSPSTGNGYFCTRGTAEWEGADGTHYPGTYAHGVYNRETTILGGNPVPNEDLVNLPNWLVLKLRIDGEEPIRLGNVELLSYRHELSFRNALVVRELGAGDECTFLVASPVAG